MEQAGTYMGIIFDKQSIHEVSIKDISVPDWHFKPHSTIEYRRIRKSIVLHGLRQPIIVRKQGAKYEVIDGKQRLDICEELGFTSMLVYIEDLTDREAQELAISYHPRVPTDEIELADLIVKLAKEHPEIKIPYDTIEIKEFQDLLKFDWDQYREKDQTLLF